MYDYQSYILDILKTQKSALVSPLTLDPICLISIKPLFAKLIFSDKKKFEFRRTPPKKKTNIFLVYESNPRKLVTGFFISHTTHSAHPNEIWDLCSQFSGVSREFFDLYFGIRTKAHALAIDDYFAFNTPLALSTFIASNRPPQSFCYIPGPANGTY